MLGLVTFGTVFLMMAVGAFVALAIEGLVAVVQTVAAWVGRGKGGRSRGPTASLGMAALITALCIPTFGIPGVALFGAGLRQHGVVVVGSSR